MSILKSVLVGTAMLSLTACQTMKAPVSPSDALLSGIEAPTTIGAVSAPKLSGSDPVCLAFYDNISAYVAQPVNVPSGPSLGGTLLKTVLLGTLAGATGGAVSAIGIESAFVESALIATASQVTYNVGDTVYDKIVSPVEIDPNVPAVPAPSPMDEIGTAAAKLGCPAPDVSAIKSLGVLAK